MERVQVGEVTLDRCPACGSIWCDAYELEAVLKTQGGASRTDIGVDEVTSGRKAITPKRCPRDKAELIEIPDPRQPHVKIDLCRTCGGVLLDEGELKDLSEFTFAERLRAFFRPK